MDRRTTIKWVLAAAATIPAMNPGVYASDDDKSVALESAGKGYGTDPDLTRIYKPGDLWPLTLTDTQKRTAAALCDLIIPADSMSPSASQVGVVAFIDEWISAPYKHPRRDRPMVLEGFQWLDKEAALRYGRGKSFATLTHRQSAAICDDICFAEKAKPNFAEAAKFFARYRDLTAGGFYSTPQGRQDVRYVGNVPLQQFDGPPLEVLKKVGLA